MIHIRLNKAENEIEISGHGGTLGNYDMSCCVVSTIACTLAETVNGHITEFEEDKGYMYIKADDSPEIKHYFNMADVGLKRAAKIFPENIKFLEQKC